MDKNSKMPILFLGHGSPMNAIEENEFVEGFRTIAKEISKPRAILCISAHWETSDTFVTAMAFPKTIHDFGGFPKRLFDVQYPAPGDPKLASDLKRSITKTEILLDENRGLDHGCWSVVKHLYPNADVPVVQMSLDYLKTPQEHYNLAKELSSFREQGILIIGSGNLVHNLRLVAWDRLNASEFGYDWALEANEIIKKCILNGDYKTLIDFPQMGKSLELAIPTAEHFLPLLYILALKDKNDPVRLFNDKIVGGSLSMTSLIIG